jgi:formate dehydrogenase maturation protein FdhE
MTLAEKLLQNFQELPDEKKRQVIDFVEFLRIKERQELEQMMDNIIAENKEAFVELAK